MSLFDGPRRAAFTSIVTLLGESASWTPSEDADPIISKVLLKEITEQNTEIGVHFTPFSYYIEWQEPHFPGLFEAAQDGESPKLVINANTYILRTAESLVSGKRFKAIGELIL